MDGAAWVALVSAVVAVVALLYTARAANSAKRQAKAAEDQTEVQRAQTELQRELARQAVQPYVWADVLPDMQQGTMLHIVLANSGTTVATDVRVVFSPPLVEGTEYGARVEAAQRRLANGIRSLSPGRVVRWSIGPGHRLLADDAPQVYRVRIEGHGPHGPLDPVEFNLDVNDWRESRDAPDGSLHHIRKSVDNLTGAVKGLKRLQTPRVEPGQPM
ncbi:hypothetical protein [Ruania halotolerans]|uniref:hypothetical protein n=1 Tax=Ruania halotolerans TaxID=2897773 RepID=UPI001E3449B9|nr:hypothetical protein [Ruania halotolerans]UFU05498.1 hypothetical protein LQF10_13720 [Ruania halotolerans]